MGGNDGERANSYPIYQDYQQRAEAFSEVFCQKMSEGVALTLDGQTELVSTEMVSGNYFSALGVKPAIGRVFNSQEDDQLYKGHPVVALSYDYWMTRFAGDQSVVGKKVLVNNYPMTIVGVSAPGFGGVDPARSPKIRVPIQMLPIVNPGWDTTISFRRLQWVRVFARLKPGYTLESAQASLQVLFTQIRQYEATLPEAKGWSAYNRERFLQATVLVEKAATGYSQLRNSFSKALAWEWAKKGVRVNNISPGWIVPHRDEDVGPGSFWNRLIVDNRGKPEQMQEALEGGHLQNMANLPIKRLGRPEDIAYLALFLASDVSGYITGQLISVSGGVYMP